MGEWIPKEQWEAEQEAKKNKQQVKIQFIIPPDVKKILNLTTQKDTLKDFLTCICHRTKDLYKLSNNMIILKCSCGMEYGYPIDHYYFNLKKTVEIPIQPLTICTCSKCHVSIEAAQAKSSLGFVGKELCITCMGQELG